MKLPPCGEFQSRMNLAMFARKYLFEFACLFKKSVLNKIQTQNGAQTLYFNLLQNNVLSMKLLYLDVLLHALLTSSTSEKSHVLSILADVRVKFSLWKHILQQKYYILCRP